MRAYQVVSGFHRRGKETYGRGEVVESELDLKATFPGKFIEVPRAEKSTKKSKLLAKKNPKTVKQEKLDKKAKIRSLRDRKKEREEIGKDVSIQFPAAIAKSLRVYKTPKNTFNVAKEDEPHDRINPTPLSKMKVNRFIGDLAE